MPDGKMPDGEMPDGEMLDGEMLDREMTDQELLSAYLDGALPPPVLRGVEDRLANDPALRREYFRLQQVSAALRVHCEADPGFVVRHRRRREDLSPVLRWTWRQLGFRLSAAAALLLVAAGVSLFQAGRTGPETSSSVEGLDIAAFEGQVLGAPEEASELLSGLSGQGFGLVGLQEDPGASEFVSVMEANPTEEPVLLIALGGAFPPPAGPGR